MLRLTKIQCFLFGLGIIALFYFINRAKHIIGSEKITGNFAFYVEEDTPEGKLVYPIIEYRIKDSIYRFKGEEATAYKVNQKVPVLLQGKDHDRPMLYTIGAFWLYPLFYWILPLIIWAAFSLSYVRKNERVLINLKYPFFRKQKEQERFPEKR